MPGLYNFILEQGTGFSRTLTWSSGSPSAPVNLTGYSAVLVIGKGSTEYLSLSSGHGLTLGGSAGTITITIDDIQLSTLTFRSANYRLDLTDSNGTPVRLLKGSVTLVPENPS